MTKFDNTTALSTSVNIRIIVSSPVTIINVTRAQAPPLTGNLLPARPVSAWQLYSLCGVVCRICYSRLLGGSGGISRLITPSPPDW